MKPSPKRYEVSLTADPVSRFVEVEANDELEAIEKAQEQNEGFSFDDETDDVIEITDSPTPEQKAIRHLHRIGIHITEPELREALRRIRQEVIK